MESEHVQFQFFELRICFDCKVAATTEHDFAVHLMTATVKRKVRDLLPRLGIAHKVDFDWSILD